MSQHTYTHTAPNRSLKVIMGYDRPLDGFFLVVEDVQADSYVYSNLWEKVSHPKTMTPFLAKLEELEIKVPDQMIAEIQQDFDVKMGNKTVRHSIDENGVYQRVQQ